MIGFPGKGQQAATPCSVSANSRTNLVLIPGEAHILCDEGHIPLGAGNLL